MIFKLVKPTYPASFEDAFQAALDWYEGDGDPDEIHFSTVPTTLLQDPVVCSALLIWHSTDD